MRNKLIETFGGFVIVVGGVALSVAILYGTYAVANSQWATDALVATGHFSDVRATATAQSQIDFDAAVQKEVDLSNQQPNNALAAEPTD